MMSTISLHVVQRLILKPQNQPVKNSTTVHQLLQPMKTPLTPKRISLHLQPLTTSISLLKTIQFHPLEPLLTLLFHHHQPHPSLIHFQTSTKISQTSSDHPLDPFSQRYSLHFFFSSL